MKHSAQIQPGLQHAVKSKSSQNLLTKREKNSADTAATEFINISN